MSLARLAEHIKGDKIGFSPVYDLGTTKSRLGYDVILQQGSRDGVALVVYEFIESMYELPDNGRTIMLVISRSGRKNQLMRLRKLSGATNRFYVQLTPGCEPFTVVGASVESTHSENFRLRRRNRRTESRLRWLSRRPYLVS